MGRKVEANFGWSPMNHSSGRQYVYEQATGQESRLVQDTDLEMDARMAIGNIAIGASSTIARVYKTVAEVNRVDDVPVVYYSDEKRA
jgi:hypothetical protein